MLESKSNSVMFYSVNLYLSVHEQNAMTRLFLFTHFISFPLTSLKKIMKPFTEDFFFFLHEGKYFLYRCCTIYKHLQLP